MLADGLLDGLHLFVYPLTLGGGARLFAEGDPPAKMTLSAAKSYANGVVYLHYATPA
jgi:dihydrofolate reductase